MTIKEIIQDSIGAAMIFAFFGFLLIFGGAFEEQIRCDNGATEYCLKGE